MNWRERLKSPTLLGVQGFALGALLFFAFHPLAPGQTPSPPPSGAMDIVVQA